MQIINFNNENLVSENDAEQMIEAIKNFKEGKKQSKGRFEIIKELKKEE